MTIHIKSKNDNSYKCQNSLHSIDTNTQRPYKNTHKENTIQQQHELEKISPTQQQDFCINSKTSFHRSTENSHNFLNKNPYNSGRNQSVYSPSGQHFQQPYQPPNTTCFDTSRHSDNHTYGDTNLTHTSTHSNNNNTTTNTDQH